MNLPILGQENQLQPTNRGLKGSDSSKGLYPLRNEESKIHQTGSGLNNQPVYFSRPTGQGMAPAQPEILSPNSKKDKNGIS